MEKKLIATALGAFGMGALVGWAVTADYRDRWHRREKQMYEGMIHSKTEHIWALQDRINRLDGNPFGVITNGNYKIGDSGVTTTNWAPPTLTVSATGTVISMVEEEDDTDTEDLEMDETPEETRSNLQSIINSYVAGDSDTQDIMNNIINNSIEDDNSPPFVISQATYAWDEEGESYDKISLSYYPRDRVLLDDEEEPIEDVNRTIGWRNLTQFGGESGDADVVFVRNRRLKTDFEVIKDDDSQLPLHVKYGMEKEEFRANKAAGLIRLRQEDDDY